MSRHPARRTVSRAALRIVVAGSIAAVPGQGGWAWVVLQYVLGLRRLGHRVLLVDPVAAAALKPRGGTLPRSVNAAYFRAVVRRFGLGDASVLMLADESRQTIGGTYRDIIDTTRRADVLINVSGALRDDAVLEAARRRVYLDLDPAFTQLWHTADGVDMGFSKHTDFVTIGLAIGTPECHAPTCGLHWITTPQPIVLACWPAVNGAARGPLTTVANWRGYGAIEHEGRVYGQKAHAWRSFMSLPALTDERFLVALAIHPEEEPDLKALAKHGWRLADPACVAFSPDQYQQFVHGSKAEFGVAKTGYVVSRCGWFSDRSICYLAAGRPVLAQDTGFGGFIPAGEGLFSFATVDDALNAIERLNAQYDRHARAARGLAERCFDSDTVLPRLLERLGVTA